MEPISQRSKPRAYSKVVSRSAADKPDYICDGTDDHVQIQAAIDAVELAGGGVVFIKTGTYVLGVTLTIDSANVNLLGEGMEAVVLQAKTAFPTNTSVVTITANYCSVKELMIDGNKANQTTENHYGIYVSGTYCTVERVEVKNTNKGASRGIGIVFQTGGRGLIENCLTHDNEGDGLYTFTTADFMIIRSVHSFSNAGEGIYIDGDQTVIEGCISYSNTLDGFYMAATDGILSNCISHTNTLDGIVVDADNVKVSNCSVYGNTRSGIYLDNGRGVVSGNMIRDNGKNGINVVGADNAVISNNVIYADTGLDADATYSGILLTGTATRNVVTGNRISGDGATNDLAYGIREAAAADDFNVIVGNITTGSDTAQISTQGTSTVSASNVIT